MSFEWFKEKSTPFWISKGHARVIINEHYLIQSNAGIARIWSNGGYEKSAYILEDYYQTPKKVFESRSIAFMVPRWFVDHKVALL